MDLSPPTITDILLKPILKNILAGAEYDMAKGYTMSLRDYIHNCTRVYLDGEGITVVPKTVDTVSKFFEQEISEENWMEHLKKSLEGNTDNAKEIFRNHCWTQWEKYQKDKSLQVESKYIEGLFEELSGGLYDRVISRPELVVKHIFEMRTKLDQLLSQEPQEVNGDKRG